MSDLDWAEGFSIKIASKYVSWPCNPPATYKEWKEICEYFMHDNCGKKEVNRLYLPEVYENLLDGGAIDLGCCYDSYDDGSSPYVRAIGKNGRFENFHIRTFQFWRKSYNERKIIYRRMFYTSAAVNRIEPDKK